MSKITLAPNASGTGTLTLAAPNTNTDRTLTLPDSTGTVLTSDGGTVTGNLTLSSGNLGIGTSSPEAKTSIVSTAGAIGLTVKDANAGGNNYFSVQYNGTTGVADIKAQSTGGSTALAFSTSSSGATSERMRIDSSGRVTMPYQPAFRVNHPAAEDNTAVSFGSKDSAFSGRDSGFNLTTGLFTAPVAGVYVFSFAFLHGNGGSATYVRCLFKINGSASVFYGDTLEDWGSSYKFTGMSMAFRLQVGDTVGLLNEGRRIYSPYGAFSGYLVG